MVLRLKCVVVFLLANFIVFGGGILSAGEAEFKFKRQKIELVFQKNKKTLEIELAQNFSEHAYGLMNRKSLDKNSGMLFVFDDESPREFWMKNTLIDLDIAYIDKGKQIVDIQTMKAVMSVLQTNLPTYPSKKPAQYALEMNAGWFKKNKFSIGTRLNILSRPTSK